MKTKFLLIAFLAVMTVFNSSCSKDDNENPDNSIIGTWKFVSSKSTGYSISDGVRTEINEDSNLTSKNQKLEIKSNNAYTLDVWDIMEEKNDLETGTYKIEGDKIILTETGNTEEPTTLTFSLKGNTLTLTSLFDENYEDIHITKLTNVSTLTRQ